MCFNKLMYVNYPRGTFLAAGLDTRVVNCIAHDGSGESQQELIDNNG